MSILSLDEFNWDSVIPASHVPPGLSQRVRAVVSLGEPHGFAPIVNQAPDVRAVQGIPGTQPMIPQGAA